MTEIKTEVLDNSDESIQKVASALQNDELVAIPTETVYGLAGNAFSEKAVTAIFKAKERPSFDPLIVHVSKGLIPQFKQNSNTNTSTPILDALENLDLIQVQGLTGEVRKKTELLLNRYWPGPLTVILPKSQQVPDLVTCGLKTVAVRMPKHSVAEKIITAAGFPLAAPSANRFGRISPTSAQDVIKELNGLIPWIVDGGDTYIGLESTVVSVGTDGDFTLLRPGAITQAQIEKVVGEDSIIVKSHSQAASKTAPQAAPGLLAHHYAPEKKLWMLSHSLSGLTGSKLDTLKEKIKGHTTVGILVMSGDPTALTGKFAQLLGVKVIAYSLTPLSEIEEAAKNLFRTLRALDESEATVLFCEPCPWKQGIGLAIIDRLSRASTPL